MPTKLSGGSGPENLPRLGLGGPVCLGLNKTMFVLLLTPMSVLSGWIISPNSGQRQASLQTQRAEEHSSHSPASLGCRVTFNWTTLGPDKQVSSGSQNVFDQVNVAPNWFKIEAVYRGSSMSRFIWSNAYFLNLKCTYLHRCALLRSQVC